MKNKCLLTLFVLSFFTGYAQNNVGIGTISPEQSAVLHLEASDKGFLMPRLSTVQRLAIGVPANGLLVYDLDQECVFYYKNTADGWISLCNAGTGSIGIIGATGHTGFTGATGLNGTQGATGVQGVTGIAGATGLVGVTGTQGLSGFVGLTGTTGLIGETGVQGIVGVTGETGIAGVTGVIGVTGIQGVTGVIGTTGLVGSTGVQGGTGVVGNTGVIGMTGIQGVTGVIGTTGLVGSTGVQGGTGVVGGTGVIGVTGIQGITGVIGTTGLVGSTGVQGGTGVVGNTGVIGMTGIQGITGVIGTTGLVGSTGVQGGTGVVGGTGVIGVTGIQGVTGVIGTTGLVGSTGVQGGTGIVGSTGVIGVTGEQGPTGVIGTTGLVGSTGVQGGTGIVGSTGVIGVTGIQGVTGVIGTTGIIGSTGVQGGTGVVGGTGVIGVTGIQGVTGVTGTTGLIGSTGMQGGTGVVGGTGVIGTTGVQGETGVIGMTGSDGFTGTQGLSGFTGLTGATGAVGETGVIGTTGAQGATGVVGATGMVGTTGANGDTGIMGETGVIGGTGIVGLSGETGLRGETGVIGGTGPAGPVGCTGPNYVLKSTGSSVTCSIMYDNGTNVGIGTINPPGRFTVASVLSDEKYVAYGAGLDGSTYQKYSFYVDSLYQVLFEAPKPGNDPLKRYDYYFSHRGDGLNTPRMVIKGNGNVGIGTNAPLTPLTVGNDTRTISEMTLWGEYQSAGFTNSNILNFRHGGYDRIRLTTEQKAAASNDFDFKIQAINSSVNGYNDWVTVKGISGNVGIGTVSPANKLEAYESGSANPQNTVLKLGGYADAVGEGPFVDFNIRWGGNYPNWIGGRIGSVYESGGSNRAALVFYTNNDNDANQGIAGTTEKMRIQGQTGNVGIGITAPGYKLDVQGASGIRIGNSTYDANLVFGNNASWKSGIRVYDNGLAEMRIWHRNTSGKIFISTGYDGDQSTALPADGLVVYGNSVGIGVPTPTAKLHIGGTAGTDGIRFPDGTLQTTASGSASFIGTLNNRDGIVSANAGYANFTAYQNSDANVFEVVTTGNFGVKIKKAGSVMWNYDQDIIISGGNYCYVNTRVDGTLIGQTLIAPTGSVWDNFHTGGAYTVTANQELTFQWGCSASDITGMDNGWWGHLSILWTK